MNEQREPGTIVTFYSYKGGVGRTFALANVAALLAQWGHRVLCVDWDLEAPGLRMYFEAEVTVSVPSRDRGLVDVVAAFAAGAESLRWADEVIQVDLGDGATVDLLGAGGGVDYLARMQALDWSELYAEHDLGRALERLRDEWRARYDFVLIDSRTGVTDIGGICTVQLPDLVALLATPNRQSIEGITRVIRAADEARERLPVERERLSFLPVVTRFDSRTERVLAVEWLGRFAEAFAPQYADWLDREVKPRDLLEHTQIPHVPFWSFGEGLPVLREGTSDPQGIGFAFETLASLLAHRLTKTEMLVTERDSYVAQAAENSRAERTDYDVMLFWTRSSDDARWMLEEQLSQAGLRVLPSEPFTDEPLLERMARTRHFVFLIDEQAQQSSWMSREARGVLRTTRNRRAGLILSVLLDDARPVRELASFQALRSGREDTAKAAMAIVQAIRAVEPE